VDLSFPRFEHDVRVTALPPDLAVMMVGIAARQACSPTARVQARLSTSLADPGRFAPADGTFNHAMAALLTGWKEE
jgi:ABC-type cobalamin transport system permease subunit